MADKKYKVADKTYEIPDAEAQNFLKDFPTAVEVEDFTVGKDTFEIPVTEREAFLKDYPQAQPIKKKGFPIPTLGEMLQGSSKESITPAQPSLSAEEKPKTKETKPFGDMLRSLKSSSMRALGGITGTPYFIEKTILGTAVRPIVKAMGATDEEANVALEAMLMTNPTGVGALGGKDIQDKLNRKAQVTEAKMKPIEGNIWQNLREHNWSEAGELAGRGFFQSLPYLAMTASTAGGGTGAVLSTIGATAAAQQYAETEGQPEPKRILNAWLYGGFEAAGELVTAGLVRGIGKSFRQGATKAVEEGFVKGASKSLAKSFGLESSSEAMTQIGQNLTDIVTGVDPNRGIFDNVFDAALIGGIAGGGIGVANMAASLIGRTLASDKEVTQIQDNVNQQGVLIDQIESTDSDPIKSALEKRLRNLRYEADKIMDKNYELAKELSPEQHARVAELYSVWNDLQAKIDNKEIVSEQEVTTTENTIEGIKEEIQSIRDSKIAELGELKGEEVKYKIGDKKFKTAEEVESWLDKNYVKHGLEPVWHEPTEKLIDSWVKKNKEKIEQEYIKGLQKEKVPQESETKTEEGVTDAERIGTQVTEGSEQPQGVVEGEETGLHLRDTSQQVPLEAQQGEEVAFKEHRTNIEQKFKDSFSGVPQEQVEGALALMDARAKSWASETGKSADEWYQRIADVKEGEFTDKSTPKLYQLPDGRQVMGMAMPEVTNGFYSPIEKRLVEFKQEKASVNKWKEIIGKGDEATFTGVSDYLNSLKPDQTLSKSDIQQFMKDNRIEVVEVQKRTYKEGGLNEQWSPGINDQGELTWNNNGWKITEKNNGKSYRVRDPQGEYFGEWDGVNARQRAQEAVALDSKTYGETKFSQYQLPGEKENYKEVLVTMPTKVKPLSDSENTELDKLLEKRLYEGLSTEEESKYRSLFTRRNTGGIEGQQFRSSHFDEPNILVHLRMNTRVGTWEIKKGDQWTDAKGNLITATENETKTGKVLFLEEVQSDFAQSYRKEESAKNDYIDKNDLKIIEAFKKKGLLKIICPP